MLPGDLWSPPAAPLTLHKPALKHFLSQMCVGKCKSAQLHEAMFGCCSLDRCLTGASVKISNHILFPLSATALIGGVWAAARAPCGGLPSRDWLRWKSNRVLIPTRPCRHWSNVNIVAEHSLIIYPATENLSTSFIAFLSTIHQPVRRIISHTGKPQLNTQPGTKANTHTTKHTISHLGKHPTSHKCKKIE